MSDFVNCHGLKVASVLHHFIEHDVLPGTGLDTQAFWSGFAGLVHELAPINRALLAERDRLQGELDTWHRAHPGPITDMAAYRSFLSGIGYLQAQPEQVKVNTANVDSEISTQAGPQLVVPAANARYALNAANARWGSLYDALYGTDVIASDGGAEAGRAYNPLRGAKVIAFARAFLDRAFPLQKGSHADATRYQIEGRTLLLNSSSAMFPHGLGNGSGMVGKHYMRHTTGSVFAEFNDPVHFYRGTIMAGLISDESRFNPDRGFVGGYEMETISLGPSFMAAFFNPGAWGRDFTRVMDNYTHLAGMWLVGEDMPRETNRITLSDTKDHLGIPVANVHYDDHPNDLAMREHAFKQGSAVYEAVGALKTHRVPPYPSTHNLGTCRMSLKEADGVCNKHGQSHEVPNLFISDGSQFTTSAAENPTLTIVSLAIRQADYIAEALKTKAA
ncbi:GMC oxidoreductase [Pseudomonas helleri]|uniref:GMC oxidoreductase n=1 Tax=Pseudomonas helleri TaxID=1608996 RepID=UPI003FD0DBE2